MGNRQIKEKKEKSKLLDNTTKKGGCNTYGGVTKKNDVCKDDRNGETVGGNSKQNPNPDFDYTTFCKFINAGQPVQGLSIIG